MDGIQRTVADVLKKRDYQEKVMGIVVFVVVVDSVVGCIINSFRLVGMAVGSDPDFCVGI